MTESTTRCGWRVDVPTDIERSFLAGTAVVVRRGEWRWTLPIEIFEAMADEDFASSVEYGYRTTVFDQLQQDLDALARQITGEVKAGNAIIVDNDLWTDVKAALYRWQKTKRDMPEVSS